MLVIDGHDANGSDTITAIVGTTHILFVDVEVKIAILRNNCQGIGLPCSCFNERTFIIYQRYDIAIASGENKAIDAQAIKSEAIEAFVVVCGAENDAAFIAFINRHLNFQREIVETGCVGKAGSIRICFKNATMQALSCKGTASSIFSWVDIPFLARFKQQWRSDGRPSAGTFYIEISQGGRCGLRLNCSLCRGNRGGFFLLDSGLRGLRPRRCFVVNIDDVESMGSRGSLRM